MPGGFRKDDDLSEDMEVDDGAEELEQPPPSTSSQSQSATPSLPLLPTPLLEDDMGEQDEDEDRPESEGVLPVQETKAVCGDEDITMSTPEVVSEKRSKKKKSKDASEKKKKVIRPMDSGGEDSDSIVQKSDHDSEDISPKERKKKVKVQEREKTSDEICAEYGLNNVDVAFCAEDYQTLNNYKAFSQFIRPLITKENPKIAVAKLVTIVAAKWREFCEKNPHESKAKQRAIEGEQLYAVLRDNQDDGSEAAEDSSPVKSKKSKSKKAVAPLKIKITKTKKRRKASTTDHQDYCQVCRQGGKIILCDMCPRAYHLVCLNPELEEAPEGKWSCPHCLRVPSSTNPEQNVNFRNLLLTTCQKEFEKDSENDQKILDKTMAIDKIQLRALICYCWKRGLSTRKAAEEICAAQGEGTIAYTAISKWYKRFDSGDMSLEDKPRSGRPVKLGDGDLQTGLDIVPSSSTRELADELGVGKSTIYRHLKQLYFVQKKPRQDPQELTEAQANRRVEICRQLLSNPLDERFWTRIVASDEKWVYLVQHHRDKRWVEKGQETPLVPKQDRFGKKVMLRVWWNFEGIVHFELVPNGLAISAELYWQQLERVYEKLKQKYPALINRKRALMQEDNAKPHTARKTKDKFEELDSIEVLPHPTYGPDCAPSDYGLFCSMQHFLKGRQFDSFDDVEEACQEFFDSKPAEWYFHQIRKLADRWQKVLENDGLYFEE